ncbi:AAA family ATPase [Mucilaginibacter sp. McL0603]|uniref:AAA family ATPase n=1 Tax=Mucilaginibacter sp. McL0603 TaxID=3415670 RepID=UPI003CEB831E
MSSQRPPHIEQLRAEARGYPLRPAKRSKPAAPAPDPDECRYVFTVFTGNRWMELGEREPESKMLFGEFWHQGELCILFADTNVGKSVLAVQIGNSIALGKPIAPFALRAKPSTVLYIDFELTAKQFYQRYTHPQGNYNFTDNFLRAQFNPITEIPGNYRSYDDYIIAGLEYRIKQVKATVLIIDNITCLRGGTENAAVALSLMQNLKALKTDLNLSILVLAHTPKRRNPGSPLSADDLHGSKLLINFADSAFSIGTSSTDHHLRYLKQIKQRSTAQVYGDDNVCLCRIQKPGNFLQFRFQGNSPERLHLRTRNTLNRELLTQKVAELSAKGLSQRQISRELHIALGYVNKLMKKDV